MGTKPGMRDFTLQPSQADAVRDLLISEVQGFADSPEFGQLDKEDRSIPGLVCAAFARFLRRFQQEELSHGLADRDARTLDDAYRVIEVLAETRDSEVENLVVTEIFENLMSEQGVHEAVRSRLEPRSKELFTRWLE